MKKWPKNRIYILVAGTLIGAVGGYLYWYYVGCTTGTCPITSKAPNSTVYGMVMGGLLAGIVWDYVKEQKAKSKTQKTTNN